MDRDIIKLTNLDAKLRVQMRLEIRDLQNRLTSVGEVTVGIRPEHVIAEPDGPLSITVQMGELLGANTLLHGWIRKTT